MPQNFNKAADSEFEYLLSLCRFVVTEWQVQGFLQKKSRFAATSYTLVGYHDRLNEKQRVFKDPDKYIASEELERDLLAVSE